jgi:spore germination cell wall hydrolase CwlJ-like protein
VALGPTARKLIVSGICLILAACGASSADRGADEVHRILAEAGHINGAGLVRLERGMNSASAALASRFDPAPHADYWDRSMAWTSLDLTHPPTLSMGALSFADAAAINAVLPADDADLAPAKPFFLQATGPERDRAVLCMTQAIYYEAALEPLQGQQAVAQTVINRMRHPDFPKSVCGVVYEGSQLPIGCQFSFTCDGSLARQPIEPFWSRAKQVAEAALDGFVATDIGPATHYHADYVFPRWGPQMVKIVQLGAHIFYRYPGPFGDPDILSGRYAGGELKVSMTGPSPAAIAAAKAALAAGQINLADMTAAPAGVAAGVAVANPAGGAPRVAAILPQTPTTVPVVQLPQPGDVIAGRRVPTKEEIAHVNAQLRATPAPSEDDGPMATAGGDQK